MKNLVSKGLNSAATEIVLNEISKALRSGNREQFEAAVQTMLKLSF